MLPLALLLAVARPAHADGKIETSGRLASGVQVKGFKHGEVETKAKLKLKTERVAKARAVVEAEVSSLKREPRLEEAFIDQKLGGGHEIEIGLGKKILGLEYELGDNERLPIRRTLIYRKLETFAYVGRETTLRYQREVEPGSGDLASMVSLGYGESLDADLIGSLRKEILPGTTLAGWALLQSDKINERRQTVWAGILSLLVDDEGTRVEAELAAGQDPFESEFQKTFGDGKNRHYAGWKVLVGHAFGTGDDGALEPLASASGLRHDVKMPRYYSLELLAGLNWRLSKALQLALNVAAVGTNSKLEPEKRTWDDSNAAFEAKYIF